jgi:hypothetical protein
MKLVGVCLALILRLKPVSDEKAVEQENEAGGFCPLLSCFGVYNTPCLVWTCFFVFVVIQYRYWG